MKILAFSVDLWLIYGKPPLARGYPLSAGRSTPRSGAWEVDENDDLHLQIFANSNTAVRTELAWVGSDGSPAWSTL
jgi:hypothetical protein